MSVLSHRFSARGGLCALCALFSVVLFTAASCALLPGYSSPSTIASENLAIAEGYSALAKYDKAAEYYEKAGRLKRYRNAADWGLARASAYKGDWERAIPLLERLHRQDTNNRLVTEAYAYALIAGGMADEGLRLYAGLADTANGDGTASVNYAEALCLAGKWEEALAASKTARERFPEIEAVARLDAVDKKCNEALAPPVKADEAETDGGESKPLPPAGEERPSGAAPDNVPPAKAP